MQPFAQAIVQVPEQVDVQSVQKVCPEFVPEQVVVQKPVQSPLHFVFDSVPASKLVIGVFISSYFTGLPSAYVALGFPEA